MLIGVEYTSEICGKPYACLQCKFVMEDVQCSM